MIRLLWIWLGLCLVFVDVLAQTSAPSVPTIPVEYKSIFFQESQLSRLIALEQKRKEQKLAGIELVETENVIESLSPIEMPPETREFTYPQFYLKSLAYNAPKQWTFWLNDAKYTSQNPSAIPELTVEDVTPNRVFFKYTVAPKDPISLSMAVPDKSIELNPTARTIRFSLASNQTFSTYSLKVYEGKIVPMKVSINIYAQTPVSLPPSVQEVFNPSPATAPPQKPEDAPEDSRGLQGLINRNKALEQFKP